MTRRWCMFVGSSVSFWAVALAAHVLVILPGLELYVVFRIEAVVKTAVGDSLPASTTSSTTSSTTGATDAASKKPPRLPEESAEESLSFLIVVLVVIVGCVSFLCGLACNGGRGAERPVGGGPNIAQVGGAGMPSHRAV